LGGHRERSQYVQISRIPEAGLGVRNVDPSDAINSKTPLNKLVAAITPSDLHYERSHAGARDLDPAKHRLLIHGMARKSLALTVDDLFGHAVGLSMPREADRRLSQPQLEDSCAYCTLAKSSISF